MRIWVNCKTKHLFGWVLLFLMVFGLLSVLAVGFKLQYAVWYVLASFVGMGILIFVVMYLYFREQDHIIECVVMQMQEYISGNHNVRIACHEEGELYRLFHEVNALVTILNAYAENEGNAKRFLKDMISDISHQCKTLLAARNLYNGILQEASMDVATVQEFTARSEQELDRIATLVQNLLKITKLDAGSGIHPEALPHIFKRFYRSCFSQDIQGLGLSLAKAVIEAHHGIMEVDSALGVGTTFTLNFVIPTKL